MEFQRLGNLAYRIAKKYNIIRMPWPTRKITIAEQKNFIKSWEYFIEYPEFGHISSKNTLIKNINPKSLEYYIK